VNVAGVVTGADVAIGVAAGGRMRVVHCLDPLYACRPKRISPTDVVISPTYWDKTDRAMTIRCTSLVPS
jgi:hypothetical protein